MLRASTGMNTLVTHLPRTVDQRRSGASVAIIGPTTTRSCRHPLGVRFLSSSMAVASEWPVALCSRVLRHFGDTVKAVDLPELLVADADEWRRWLSAHHADAQGVWLVLAKKGTADPTTLSYDEALDEAICFGWIDGQLERRDSATFRRRFTPRKVRSPWSQRNAAIAERLIASGRMHQSGA